LKNKNVNIRQISILSDAHYVLKKVDFDYLTQKGTWQQQSRECYDRGDGAAILLFNTERKKVILTKQFRMPSFLNQNTSGMMIEVCAGLLDNENPETCIVKEAEEETGYHIDKPQKIFELYSTPGAVTEKIHYFIAPYTDEMRKSKGGGLESETEEIEVLELDGSEAVTMIYNGEIKDAKTVILLLYAKSKNLI
jgi:nudix-type nucleoside diphosphatase (YffH/AdpP family)